MAPSRTGKRVAGVRDAKARLSSILADVRLGREWIITERGVPIARMVPVAAEAPPLEERLRQLEAAGTLEPRPADQIALPPVLAVPTGLARRLLDEDRG